MPTRLPPQLPAFRDKARLAGLLLAFHWYGFRRRAAGRRMAWIGTDRGYARWARATHRWLDCSAKIAALLNSPEPPEAQRMRKAIDATRQNRPGP